MCECVFIEATHQDFMCLLRLRHVFSSDSAQQSQATLAMRILHRQVFHLLLEYFILND